MSRFQIDKHNVLVMAGESGRALSANSVQALYHKNQKRLAQRVRSYSVALEDYNHAWIWLVSPFCTCFYTQWLNTHRDTKTIHRFKINIKMSLF